MLSLLSSLEEGDEDEDDDDDSRNRVYGVLLCSENSIKLEWIQLYVVVKVEEENRFCLLFNFINDFGGLVMEMKHDELPKMEQRFYSSDLERDDQGLKLDGALGHQTFCASFFSSIVKFEVGRTLEVPDISHKVAVGAIQVLDRKVLEFFLDEGFRIMEATPLMRYADKRWKGLVLKPSLVISKMVVLHATKEDDNPKKSPWMQESFVFFHVSNTVVNHASKDDGDRKKGSWVQEASVNFHVLGMNVGSSRTGLKFWTQEQLGLLIQKVREMEDTSRCDSPKLLEAFLSEGSLHSLINLAWWRSDMKGDSRGEVGCSSLNSPVLIGSPGTMRMKEAVDEHALRHYPDKQACNSKKILCLQDAVTEHALQCLMKPEKEKRRDNRRDSKEERNFGTGRKRNGEDGVEVKLGPAVNDSLDLVATTDNNAFSAPMHKGTYSTEKADFGTVEKYFFEKHILAFGSSNTLIQLGSSESEKVHLISLWKKAITCFFQTDDKAREVFPHMPRLFEKAMERDFCLLASIIQQPPGKDLGKEYTLDFISRQEKSSCPCQRPAVPCSTPTGCLLTKEKENALCIVIFMYFLICKRTLILDV